MVRRKRIEVSKQLRRQVDELAEEVERIKAVVDAIDKGIVRDQEALDDVSRRARAAWSGIRVRWTKADVQRQVLDAVNTAAVWTIRGEPLKRNVDGAISQIKAIMTDALAIAAVGAPHDVLRERVEGAVKAHISPSGRGRPRKGTTALSKAQAVSELLLSLGLMRSGVEVPSEAARKRISRARK